MQFFWNIPGIFHNQKIHFFGCDTFFFWNIPYHVFFYVHLDVLVATWSLPPATFSYQNIQILQKGVQRLSRSLPAATWNYQKR